MYDEGLAKLDSRARVAMIVLWVFVAVSVLTGVGETLEAAGALSLETDTGLLIMAPG